jgi:molybdate transport system substrate-binding protein
MTLHIISAGAAQSVVHAVRTAWEREGRGSISVSYGAVGAQRAKLVDGAPADVVILTAALIDQLIGSGHIVAGTRVDLGEVVGAIAVTAGASHPAVATPEALSAALQAAAAVYLPDPATATAGAQFQRMCEGLGIAAAMQPKLRPFPNGFAAMTRMAEERVPGAIGCTQLTEILWVQGVELVAPLPRALQVPTVYACGIATRAADPAAAKAFVARLAGEGAAAVLAQAGFGVR